MSLKSYIVPRVTERIFGENRLHAKRGKYERQRVKSGAAHEVEFFHDPSDPYSQLLEKTLTTLKANYKIDIITHVVSPPDDGAAPEREMLANYAKTDAMNLAKKAGIDFSVKTAAPATDTSRADALREKRGHYLGGTLYYGGEWYWGLDRLHYLETRLTALGVRKGGVRKESVRKRGVRKESVRENNVAGNIYDPPNVPSGAGNRVPSGAGNRVSSGGRAPSGTGNTGAELHWYLSFRSPYTAIVCDRVKALADAYTAELKCRFVLPMVMRGLPVPLAKRKYIPLDTAREARRLGIPFGRFIDPVGKPVELGYSLIPFAREQGREFDYIQSWLAGVWAQGINAGSPRGIRKIVERAGLDWQAAKSVLDNDDWRIEAETNRAEMMARGIWGVPSFRVGKTITWGQDRLWVVEDVLQKIATK